MKEIKLNDKMLAEYRKFIKNAYQILGQLEGVKNSGFPMLSIDTTIEAYKSFIQVLEILIDDESSISIDRKLNKDELKRLKEKLAIKD